MPTQKATYTGGWNMFYNDRANQSGKFTADADFASRTLNLNFTGDATGSGGGSISGNTFNASFDLNTPIVTPSGSTPVPNPYNVRGGFFGPAAEEMGGIISGNLSGASINGPDADVPNPAHPFPTIFGGTLWGRR